MSASFFGPAVSAAIPPSISPTVRTLAQNSINRWGVAEFRELDVTSIKANLDSILQELVATLRARYGDRYRGLWVYGSEARGEAHPDSDVDLLLILRDANRPTREIDRIADILADFNLRYGVLLSVLPVDENTLKTSEGPFWRNLRREGKAA